MIKPALGLALGQSFLVVTFTIFPTVLRSDIISPIAMFFIHNYENRGHVDQQLAEGYTAHK